MSESSASAADRIRRVSVLMADGLTQLEVGARLGMSQSSVSRLLKEARLQGLLLPARPHCPLTEEEKALVRAQIYHGGLQERLRSLNGALQTVSVFDSGEHSGVNATERRRLQVERLGSRAAPSFVKNVLERSSVVGVTWGLSIYELSRGVRHVLQGQRPLSSPVKFVPVCGDPPRQAMSDARRSSSHVAAAMHEIVNGKVDFPLSLSGVTASIPARFDRSGQIQVVRQFIEDLGDYRQIFGSDGHPGEVHAVDAIVTGVGTSSIPDPWLHAAAAEVDAGDHLKQWTIGNIGGVFLERPNLSDADRHNLEQINARWTGILYEHFEACAKRAADSPASNVGVVVVAGGPKDEIVVECVRRGLVNHLILDHELASAVDARLRETDKE